MLRQGRDNSRYCFLCKMKFIKIVYVFNYPATAFNYLNYCNFLFDYLALKIILLVVTAFLQTSQLFTDRVQLLLTELNKAAVNTGINVLMVLASFIAQT